MGGVSRLRRGPVAARIGPLAALAAAAALCVAAVPGAAAPATGMRDRPLKVGLVLSAGVDTPFEGIAYRGLRRAVEELGVEGRVLVEGTKEGSLPSLLYLARRRYDLIMGFSNLDPVSLDAAARAFPRVEFVDLDAPWTAARPHNVRGTVYRVEEASYLAGYLAVLVEEREHRPHVLGTVGGAKLPPVDRFIAGFRAGARRADPRVRLLNSYANDFLDPAKCAAAARQELERGAGVVFQVAGGCGLGALEAAGRGGAWGIGVDGDESYLGPFVLTSVLKRLDTAALGAVRTLRAGSLRTGRTAVYSLRGGGVGLGRISPRVPRPLLARVARIRRQIVSGRIAGIPTAIR